ncbi:MAG: polysaccharide lyase 6 family protein [Cyclobacteriaceae bacterium]
MKNLIRFIAIMICGNLLAQSKTIVVGDIEEFENAVENVSPGSTIKLKNGIWEDVELAFYADGSEGDSITLTAETPGEVILTGSSKLRIAGEYLIIKNLDFSGGQSDGDAIISFRRSSSDVANHSRVTNCRIINYNPSSDETEYKWVSLYGEHNRVDHCNFEGKNNEGALLVVWLSGSANNHRIDHNYFANIPELGRNGGETIRIGTSTNSMTESRTIVEHNLFESCDGEIEIISNKSGFNIFRYNTFLDSEGTLTLRHGNDCEVYGNFFIGGNKDSGGVRIIGERHKVYNNYFEGLDGDGFRAALSITNGVPDSPLNRYFQVKDAEVVHNTFVACKEPIAIGAGKSSELSLPPINSVIANNVIDKTTGSRAFTYDDDPEGFTYSSNYVNGNIGVSENGIANLNPELTQSFGIWRLSESSPMIDISSTSFEYVTEDIDGHDRGDDPDAGSDEYSTSSPINIPLSKDDAGFQWEIDTTALATSIHKSECGIVLTNDRLKIIGIDGRHYPLRIVLYNLNGSTLLDKFSSTDSLELDRIGDRVLIVRLLDKTGQPFFYGKTIVWRLK